MLSMLPPELLCFVMEQRLRELRAEAEIERKLRTARMAARQASRGSTPRQDRSSLGPGATISPQRQARG